MRDEVVERNDAQNVTLAVDAHRGVGGRRHDRVEQRAQRPGRTDAFRRHDHTSGPVPPPEPALARHHTELTDIGNGAHRHDVGTNKRKTLEPASIAEELSYKRVGRTLENFVRGGELVNVTTRAQDGDSVTEEHGLLDIR